MEIETKSFSRYHWNVNYKQTTLSYLSTLPDMQVLLQTSRRDKNFK